MTPRSLNATSTRTTRHDQPNHGKPYGGPAGPYMGSIPIRAGAPGGGPKRAAETSPGAKIHSRVISDARNIIDQVNKLKQDVCRSQ